MAVPASRTGHPLAEAICELTAPPERPMFCCVMPLHAVHGPGVVLHMRPRPHVADFEVATYGVRSVGDPEAGLFSAYPDAAAVFAVPLTSAGVAAFAGALVHHGRWLCPPAAEEPEPAEPHVFALQPTADSGATTGGHAIVLDLFAGSEVGLLLNPDGGGGGGGAIGMLQFAFPPTVFAPSAARYSAVVRNRGAAYAAQQAQRRMQLLRADPPELYEQKFQQLRDASIQDLVDCLASMIAQGSRYRGPPTPMISPPSSPPLELAASVAAPQESEEDSVAVSEAGGG